MECDSMPYGRLPNSHLEHKLPIAPWLCWRSKGSSWFFARRLFSSSIVDSLFEHGPKIFHWPEQVDAWSICVLGDEANALLPEVSQCVIGIDRTVHPWLTTPNAVMLTDEGADSGAEKSDIVVKESSLQSKSSSRLLLGAQPLGIEPRPIRH